MEKVKRFKDIPEREWIKLTAQYIDNHNTAMILSKDDDKKYCEIMMDMTKFIAQLYKNVLSEDILIEFMIKFIYVYEFKLNVKNSKYGMNISPEDLFYLIKKKWNVDIYKKLKK